MKTKGSAKSLSQQRKGPKIPTLNYPLSVPATSLKLKGINNMTRYSVGRTDLNFTPTPPPSQRHFYKGQDGLRVPTTPMGRHPPMAKNELSLHSPSCHSIFIVKGNRLSEPLVLT